MPSPDSVKVPEMVERVARALATAAGGKISGPSRSAAKDEFGWGPGGRFIAQYVERHWREHITAAAMAIDAMREPTVTMFEAGRALLDAGVAAKQQDPEGDSPDTVRERWRVMIDKALAR
jgi:hypothetical protein